MCLYVRERLCVCVFECTVKNWKKFPINFWSILRYWVSQNLTYFLTNKAHLLICTFWPSFWLSTSSWFTFWPFFAYGQAVVHIDFWVWDSNPDVRSKSSLNLLWNLFWFFTVCVKERSNLIRDIFHTHAWFNRTPTTQMKHSYECDVDFGCKIIITVVENVLLALSLSFFLAVRNRVVSKIQGLFVSVVVGCCNNSSAQKEEPIYKSKQMKNVSIMMLLMLMLQMLLLWTSCHVMDHSSAFFDTVTRCCCCCCCCHCQKTFGLNKVMLLLML